MRSRATKFLDALLVTAFVVTVVPRVTALSGLRPPAAIPATRQLMPAQIAHLIGTAYGDPRARIASVRKDQTEGPPFHPMYGMELTGHFRHGTLRASSLFFSAVADHLYVWTIRAYSGQHLIWAVDEWPASWVVAIATPLPR